MRQFGIVLIILGSIILLLIFGPVLKEEAQYWSDNIYGIKYSLDFDPRFLNSNQRPITPVDTNFGIVIPKIDVNAEIFPEIDPTDPSIYLPVLKKGVAHAKGSSYPYKKGNVFLFAHSTDAFYNVGQYNAVFYLLGKLNNGDEIDIFYNQKRYKYVVYDKVVVSPELLSSYVLEHTNTETNTLTLQTCYPPGTTLQRLIILAKQGFALE